jgi:hypothetical protein
MTSLEGWSSAIELHPRATTRLPSICRQSGWSDSNRRPQRPKRCALTKLRYSPNLQGYPDSGSSLRSSRASGNRRFVLSRWQLEQPTSHFLISSSIVTVPETWRSRDISSLLDAVWSKSTASGGKASPQSTQGCRLSSRTITRWRAIRARRLLPTSRRCLSILLFGVPIAPSRLRTIPAMRLQTSSLSVPEVESPERTTTLTARTTSHTHVNGIPTDGDGFEHWSQHRHRAMVWVEIVASGSWYIGSVDH